MKEERAQEKKKETGAERARMEGAFPSRFATWVYIIGFLAIIFVAGIVSDVRAVIYARTGEPDHSYWVSESASEFESHYIAGFPGKFQMLNLNGLTHRLFGQREMNHVLRMNNGYLAELQAQIPEESLVRRAHMLADLQDALTERGVEFLYVATPTKISAAEENLLPAGVTDYSDANLDTFLDVLRERGTNMIDLRQMIREEGDNYYDYFYVTDHHWTTEAGFYAYEKIADWIGAQGYAIDPRVRDLSQYERTVYPRAHLGSRGRRTGAWYAGVDDFTLYSPQFPTDVEALGGARGDFEEMLLNRAFLDDHNYYMSDTYDSVLEQSVGHFINHLSENDAKIIFVADSYCFAVCPYLTLSVGQIYCVSAYTPQGLAALVEQVQPDAVIVMHCSIMNLITDESFTFGFEEPAG